MKRQVEADPEDLMFDVEAIRKELEPQLEAMDGVRARALGLLEDLREAVEMENSLQEELLHLKREVLLVAARLRRVGAHEDPRVAPHWLRLLALVEWHPDLPPGDWRPSGDDLARNESMLAQAEAGDAD